MTSLPQAEPEPQVPAAAALDELAPRSPGAARDHRLRTWEAAGLAAAATALSAASGYPILADPLSGVRFGPHDRSGVIDAYDPFLRTGNQRPSNLNS